MQITRLPDITLRDFATPGPPRSPGLHLTQITGHILKQVAPSRYGRDMPEADRENYQEAGFMWEDLLGDVFAKRALASMMGDAVRFRPDELTKDGVAGSPDALVFENDTWIVEEYKCTWKSARTVDTPEPGAGLMDEKFMGYLLQMKGYCAMAESLRSRLYILFLNGEYGERMVPEVRAYDFVWTPRDIDEQWRMFLNTARKEGWL